jgi:peptidyl-prolyl cis-trans isomerase B (cyclophilin B)
MKKKIFIIAGVILVVGLIAVALFLPEKKELIKGVNMLGIDFNVDGNETSLEKYETENPVVAMYIENYGAVVMELYPDIAPNTVNNFIYLVKNGFYDDNTFHRLMKGFVLQGGDPTGTGTGGPGYYIKGEFTNNGFQNDLKHEEGVLSMARSSSADSAGSQFFIMLGTAEHLDGNYAAFGKVIDGMDYVKKIEETEEVENEQSGKLATNLVLKKAVVDLKGKKYPNVEIIKQ